MISKTAFETLESISKIDNEDARRQKLREELAKNQALSTIIQYTYHPDVVFDLPAGPLPETIAKKSGHTEAGVLYGNVKRLYQFRKEFDMNKTKKEMNFISVYESVASDDADLLIAVKDKTLPWDNLNAAFVVAAVPELFPAGYVPAVKTEVEDKQPTFQQSKSTKSQSNAQLARDIIRNNPEAERKQILEMMVASGIKSNVAVNYYQKFKIK